MCFDDSKTVVKIRGKRDGIQAEKWRVGKRRKPHLKQRISSLKHDPLADARRSRSGSSDPRRRKRMHEYGLSRLEALPTEIVQQIFVWSENIDLALSSPALAEKLSGDHLQQVMATRMLFAVPSAEQATQEDHLSSAARLLSSRFVTWSWLRSWLRQALSAIAGAPQQSLSDTELWAQLSLSARLMPPVKLLRGPFTSDKSDFLALFSSRSLPENSLQREIAYEGLRQAIQERQASPISHILSMGVKPSTELLRSAVIDHGCDKDVVRLLVTARQDSEGTSSNESSDLDLLDPAVWAWAEETRDQGDERGSWLISLLRDT